MTAIQCLFLKQHFLQHILFITVNVRYKIITMIGFFEGFGEFPRKNSCTAKLAEKGAMRERIDQVLYT